MKRIILCLLSSLLLIGVFICPVSADEDKTELEYDSYLTTDEPAMPFISENPNSINSLQESAELTKKREIWLEQVIDYNEEHYGQLVTTVEEDKEKYTLYFEPKEEPNCESIIHDYNLDGIEEIDQDKWGVSKIEYIKPEASLIETVPASAQLNSTIVVDGTTYDYKFTYYYAWSDGYYEVASKSYSSYIAIAADALMNFTIDLNSELVKWVISQAMGAAFNQMDQSKPVKAKTYNKFYYENKVCSVKRTGTSMWYPTCQIGRRCAFGWCWTTVTKSTGEPLIKYNAPKNANAIPPTNYDSQAKKSYFDNNTWMAKKAIEKMTTGGYVDVYAICTTPRN